MIACEAELVVGCLLLLPPAVDAAATAAASAAAAAAVRHSVLTFLNDRSCHVLIALAVVVFVVVVAVFPAAF